MDQLTLEKYADLLLKIGLDIREGDRLHILFDENSLPLVRILARKAWAMGVEDIFYQFRDDELTRSFYDKACDKAVGFYPDFRVETEKQLYEHKYHNLWITGSNPDLLKQADPKRLAARNKVLNEKTGPLDKYIMQNLVKWCGAAVPSKPWAERMFPGSERAEEQLEEALIKVCRLDADDPVEAWKKHDASLKHAEAWLNEMDFDRLIYKGPGTDLTVGLVKGHRWVGGSSDWGKDQKFMANIPTEEIFTMPDKYRVEGTLRATKPFCYNGKVIEGMRLVFKKGRVVSFSAETNEEVLRDFFENEKNTRYLGEAAIVSDDTPISQSGLLFYDTLFDENASCHFAFGQAYSENLPGSEDYDSEQMEQCWMNESFEHEDFMVGGPELDITGVRKDGEEVPILRSGVWSIK